MTFSNTKVSHSLNESRKARVKAKQSCDCTHVTKGMLCGVMQSEIQIELEGRVQMR